MLPVAGATVTDATGTTVTVTDAVPERPSLVAVIVTGPPAATPVTRPLLETVASPALLVLQVTGRLNRLPAASRSVAASWTDWPV
jgi:hypothetical protein